MATMGVQGYWISALLLLFGVQLVFCMDISRLFSQPVDPSPSKVKLLNAQSRIILTGKQHGSYRTSNQQHVIGKQKTLEQMNRLRMRRVLRRDLLKVGQAFLPGLMGPTSSLVTRLHKHQRDRRTRSLETQSKNFHDAPMQLPSAAFSQEDENAPTNTLIKELHLNTETYTHKIRHLIPDKPTERSLQGIEMSQATNTPEFDIENNSVRQMPSERQTHQANTGPDQSYYANNLISSSDGDQSDDLLMTSRKSIVNNLIPTRRCQRLLNLLTRFNHSDPSSVKEMEMSLYRNIHDTGSKNDTVDDAKSHRLLIHRCLRQLFYRVNQHRRRGTHVKRSSGYETMTFEELLNSLSQPAATASPPREEPKHSRKRNRSRSGNRHRSYGDNDQSSAENGGGRVTFPDDDAIFTLPENSKKGGTEHPEPLMLLYMQRSHMIMRISSNGRVEGVQKTRADVFCVIRFVPVGQQGNVIVKLKGEMTKLYLALHSNGTLYTTRQSTDPNTDFFHEYDAVSYDAYLSRHRSYIAFNSNGEPFPGRVNSLATKKGRLLGLKVGQELKNSLQSRERNVNVNQVAFPTASMANITQPLQPLVVDGSHVSDSTNQTEATPTALPNGNTNQTVVSTTGTSQVPSVTTIEATTTTQIRQNEQLGKRKKGKGKGKGRKRNGRKRNGRKGKGRKRCKKRSKNRRGRSKKCRRRRNKKGRKKKKSGRARNRRSLLRQTPIYVPWRYRRDVDDNMRTLRTRSVGLLNRLLALKSAWSSDSTGRGRLGAWSPNVKTAYVRRSADTT